MARGAVGSAVFFVVAPGTVVGLVPWLITDWQRPGEIPVVLAVVGWSMVLLGAGVLLTAFRQFVVEGLGTPAPVAPTDRLVVGGLYRHVRNPMYLALYAAIGGQAVVFESLGVLWWLLVVAIATFLFVTFYEQPALRSRYGAAYDDFCAAVPGWWPRWTPYQPDLAPERHRQP